MAALPATPDAGSGWTSPVAATIRMVTGSEPGRRINHAKRAAVRVVEAVRAAGLIVLAVAAFVYAAFQITEVVGFVVLGLGLLLLDWCRRPGRPPVDSGPP